MEHLKAIVFIRPTEENIQILEKEINDPKYAEYYICIIIIIYKIVFSNVCDQILLKELAQHDSKKVIRSVYEYYGDYFAITPTLFTIDRPRCMMCLHPPGKWGKVGDDLFRHEVQCIVAALLSCKYRPQIRYQDGSEGARRLAEEIKHQIEVEDNRGSLFQYPSNPPPLLLIFDRREDPITPLLLQWTYQAMIHELLGINNNEVDMSRVPNIKDEMKTIVLTTEHDDFYRDHIMDNFGDLGSAVKELTQKYAKENKKNTNIETVEDMQRFVETYGDFRKLSTSVSKHVSLLTEMTRLVDQRSIFYF